MKRFALSSALALLIGHGAFAANSTMSHTAPPSTWQLYFRTHSLDFPQVFRSHHPGPDWILRHEQKVRFKPVGRDNRGRDGGCRSCFQPRNRTMGDVIAPSNFAGRLADLAPLQGFPLLMVGQLRLPAHLYPPRLGEFTALAGARADELAFKFSQAAQDGEHKAAMGGGGIGPGIAQRQETSLSTGDRGEGVEQVSG